MNILTITYDLSIRGTAKAAVLFTLAYKKLGHNVAVLSPDVSGIRHECLRNAGVKLFVNENISESLKQAKEWGVDVVHLHRGGSFDHASLEILTFMREKAPHLICIETSIFGRVDYSSTHSLIDLHMHVSAFNLWRWRKWLGRQGHQLGILAPNPIDNSSFLRATPQKIILQRQEWGIPENAYVCLHLGYKASKLIFDGFKELASKIPEAYLIFVPYIDSLDKYLEYLPKNTRDRVIKIKKAQSEENLTIMISASDCLLHGAEQGETFGYVLAEAQMCGVPIVTISRPYRDNAQVEIVQHGVTGIVVGKSSFFPAAVLDLYKNKELRELARKIGPNRIREIYSSELVAGLALRAVNHLRQHRSFRARELALTTDPFLKTHIGYDIFEVAAKQAFGGISVTDYILMKFILNPWLQKFVRLIRHRELIILGKKIL